MMEICEQLSLMGHDVFMSKFAHYFVGKTDAEKEVIKLHQKNKNDAIREFWKPMQNADAQLVVNVDKDGVKNYIGGNAFLEMGFAHVLNQKIFLLNPIPEMPYYKTEIVAMRPEIINGDLSKIK
jgi:hypothetical protein